MRKLLAALSLFLAVPTFADDAQTRLPVMTTLPVIKTMRPGLNTTDTYAVPIKTMMVVYFADTDVRVSYKTAATDSWPIGAAQYYPDPVLLYPNDTIVASCAVCSATESATLRLKLYAASKPN